MLRLAVATVATAWCLQYLDTRWLLTVPAPAWALAALGAWCLAGGRAAVIVLMAGWTLVRADWVIAQRLPELLVGQDVLVRGTVCDFPRADRDATRFVLAVDGDPLAPALPRQLHVSWYDEAPALQPGERWQLRVRLRAPRGLANPAGLDFEEWLYVRGIGASGYVRRSSLNERMAARSWTCAVGSARAALARRIERALGPHPAGAWVLGVAVGATHRMTDQDWDLLRRTGTTHLLAISGLNIAMVAAPFLLAAPVLGRLWSRAAGRPLLGILPATAAAGLYTALAGFAISTVRALVMLSLASALALRRRELDPLELLGAAAFAAVLLHPAGILTASFWLSFIAVAWLFVASSGMRPHEQGEPVAGAFRRVEHAAAVAGRTQLVLCVGLAPLSLAWFQQVSLVAPLTNLVAVPVFSLAVMPLTLAGTALVAVAPAAGGAPLRLAADVVEGLRSFLRLAAATPVAVFEPAPAGAAGLAVALAGVALLCWWRPIPLRPLALALLLPLVAGARVDPPELRLTVMDVGQGLAALVQTAHHALLYDAGPAFRMRDAGESVVVPVLRAAGVRALDTLVVSHDDQDHRGGARTVLEAWPQAVLIAPERSDLMAARFERCIAGLEWEWDGVRFRVLSPDAAGRRKSDNDGSCVLRVETDGASLLLPGDIERAREERLAAAGALAPADIVVAPHHGSRSSSGSALVEASRPRFVVLSAGHRNRWGFPAPEVTRRWEESGACLLDTAGQGAIVLGMAEGRWRIERLERLHGAHLWSAPGGVRECAKDGSPLG